MMGIPYLITFKPAGRFYFGTSQSFGEGFYAVSSMFPSQTTILGAIRATILEQSKNNLFDLEKRLPLKGKETEISALTGTSKMTGIDDADNNFGKIKKLSPVFLVKQKTGSSCADDFLFPAPSDVFYDNDELKRIEFKPDKNIKVLSREAKHHSYHYEKRIKEHNAEYLGGIQFWDEYKNKKKLTLHKSYLSESIFIHDSQPGIARENRNKKEEYFYTKKDFRLAKEYSFGVIVHFSEENVIADTDVFMGGEHSLFKLKAAKLPLTLSHIFKDHPIINRFMDEKDFGDYNGEKDVSFNNEKLVLISQFVGKESSLPDLEFAMINEMQVPRSLSSRKSKSDSFRVIPAGSILFTGDKLKKSNTYSIPSKIGYNFAIKF